MKVPPPLTMTDEKFYTAVSLAITKSDHWGGDIGLHKDDIRRFRTHQFNVVYRRQQGCDVLYSGGDRVHLVRVWETDRVKPGVLLILHPLVRMTLHNLPEFEKAKKRVVLYGTPPKKRPRKAELLPSRFDREDVV